MHEYQCECCRELVDQVARIDDLTVREREILFRLPRGVTNRALASELDISERTIKAHVTNIIAKLGVESRTRAAIVGFACKHSLDTLAGVPRSHGDAARLRE